MRVAVPTTEDTGREASVAAHFGRTEGITVVDTETGATDFAAHSGGHGPDANPPPFTVFETDAEVLLAGQIGRGAVTKLRENGIAVFRGAEGTVGEAIARWEAGDLIEVEPEDVHGHGDHDHGHHDGHGQGHHDDHGNHDEHDHGHHGDHGHDHEKGSHDHGHDHGDCSGDC